MERSITFLSVKSGVWGVADTYGNTTVCLWQTAVLALSALLCTVVYDCTNVYLLTIEKVLISN